ncbi:MAG: ankyrin repeat domain-containing protein [Gemmatimonadales bacterium]
MVMLLFLVLVLSGCAAPTPAVVDRAESMLSAVRADSIPAVKSLLADGISPDTMGIDGTRPLTEAARNDRLDAVALLLDAGARANLADSSGSRAIDYAVALGHRDVVVLLVQRAARAAGMSREALDWFNAVAHPDEPLLDWHRVLDGELASLGLCYAVLERRADVVVSMRRAGGIPNRTGYSALSLAARFGELDAVRTLLAANVNPDVEAANRLRETPLMDAARDGEVAVARALIHAGARVDHFDANRETALTWAVRAGETDYARVLLDAGANATLRNRDGLSPLDIATRINHHDLIELLSAPARRAQHVFRRGSAS